VGCGPGQVTTRLHELGIDAFGIDLSLAMIDLARRDHPGLRFEVGSMTDLRLADASVAGLLGFHADGGSRLKTQGYGGHPMKVCVRRRQPGQVAAWLRDAGFTIEAQMLVNPDDRVPTRTPLRAPPALAPRATPVTARCLL
jgi:SAM-dependent methyltransferase